MSPVNQPAPSLEIEEWVQGEGSTIADQAGKVIIITVFQVNCPGCFLGGLPETIELYEQFHDKGLVVWGLSTAFEDYNLNTLDNLRKLLTTGEVIGETQAYLSQKNLLHMGKWAHRIPFPVAFDKIEKRNDTVDPAEIQLYLERDFPNYLDMPGYALDMAKNQIKVYLKRKQFNAKTFDKYGLRGTPSSIIIDKKGILRHKLFGSGLGLNSFIEPLLAE